MDWEAGIVAVLVFAVIIFLMSTLDSDSRTEDPEKKHRDDEDDWIAL
jgi:hypothetical protein